MPPATQVCLISATLPHVIVEMSSKFMTVLICILAKRDKLTLEPIKQFFVAVEREEWKLETLWYLYDMLTATQAVTFCYIKSNVDCQLRALHTSTGRPVKYFNKTLKIHET